MSFRYDGDDVKEGDDKRRNVSASHDPNLVLRLRGGGDAKLGAKKVGRPKKSSTAPAGAARARTREKSLSDKNDVAAVEKGVESGTETIDLEESVHKEEVGDQEEDDLVKEEKIINQIVLEETDIVGEKVYEEKDCDCDEALNCGHGMRPMKFCPCYKALGEKSEVKEGANEIQCHQCKIWWHCECAGLVNLTCEAARDMVNWKGPCCFVLNEFIKTLLKSESEVIEDGDSEAPVTLKQLREELIVLEGKLRPVSTANNKVLSTPVDARSSETIRLILKEELHVTSGMMAAQIGDKVNQAITTKTKSWAEALKKKATVVVDKDAMEEIVNSTTDHSVKSNEMKASDTEHQRRRRIRNIVVKNVAECTDKDPKKRMAYDMRFLNEVLGVGQGDILTCFRAGARRTNADSNKPRPLVCTLKTADDVEYWTDGGNGWRVTNPKDKATPYWINRDLCAADADAGFRARKAAELKRDQRREAEGHQQKLC